jgi:hypothetical protein
MKLVWFCIYLHYARDNFWAKSGYFYRVYNTNTAVYAKFTNFTRLRFFFLQHLAINLCSFTHSKTLFLAVMLFCLLFLPWSKFSLMLGTPIAWLHSHHYNLKAAKLLLALLVRTDMLYKTKITTPKLLHVWYVQEYLDTFPSNSNAHI